MEFLGGGPGDYYDKDGYYIVDSHIYGPSECKECGFFYFETCANCHTEELRLASLTKCNIPDIDCAKFLYKHGPLSKYSKYAKGRELYNRIMTLVRVQQEYLKEEI